MTSTLYLVAPDSLRSWFAWFVRREPGDEVRFVGEGKELAAPVDDAAEFGSVVVLSGHDSLRRDLALAEALRSAGARVHVQSTAAAELALDKVAQKRFFDAHGHATPAWGATDPPRGRPVLVKQRRGTQSQGLRLADERPPGPGEFWELFEPGLELSVVVYVDGARTASLPVVEKGPTSLSLVPPWRRRRTCPAVLPQRDADAVRAFATEICVDAGVEGHCEVELLRCGEGALMVLELNPRVAGTMRISALAADVPVFSLARLPQLAGPLPARRHAVEEPYAGVPFSDPQRHIFATSRLTVAGDTPADVEAALSRVRAG